MASDSTSPDQLRPSRRLLLAGYALWGEGYPNARNTVRIIGEQLGVGVVDCGFRLPGDFHLWRLARSGKRATIVGLARLLAGNLASAMILLARARRDDIAYVPHPSLFLLWLLSWIPTRWRPTCICDAYITLWDTLFEDRNLGGTSAGMLSRLLLAAESRALRAAARVVVDTAANAEHVAQRFGVPRPRLSAIPLATDASGMTPPDPPQSPRNDQEDGIINVLFVGTFVPLQGTTRIAAALERLRDDASLRFTLIGDGQAAGTVEQALQANPRVRWLRRWTSPAEIECELRQADICLGVFGGEGKASRVLPFKLYAALAAGKPIITQQDYGLPEGTPPLPAVLVDPDPPALAEAIQRLARSTSQREALAARARLYFRDHLGAATIAAHWRNWLN